MPHSVLLGEEQNDFAAERLEAERQYPFIENFRNVQIAPSKVVNKGGGGEFEEADSLNNPRPGAPTITIGQQSVDLPGGVVGSIISDMVHAALRSTSDVSSKFRSLTKELVGSLSTGELAFAKKKYEADFRGKQSGSNFATFENFINTFWVEGMIQKSLVPHPGGELDDIKRGSPRSVPVFEKINKLFKERLPGVKK